MRILPLAEVKAKLSQLVADVTATDEEVTITKNGQATAVLVSYEEFESWQETLAVLSDQELVKEIHTGMQQLKQERGKLLTDTDLNQLFADES
ncbi:MAG: type II toxin-antitoxin system Phd/YefM family antitoxin [Desulfurellaceae bacterium]|nr:type II toxin-antitoxin system Phd/YefM family antitoxin [Desulfurellaceae bacterium]